MTTLTTERLSTELLEDTLLTLEQITTGMTVLALNAARCPEESPRVRVLLSEVLALLQECERDLGTYTSFLDA